MAEQRHRVTLQIGPRVPPREYRLFPYGEISTRKGKFQLTQESAREVMAAYLEHGVDIMIDYEHGALAPQASLSGAAPAAAWARLELRHDGIWMVGIKWSEKAANYLRRGEYRYLSPAFNVDAKTNEITELINVAITNLPATDHIAPLVAASRVRAMGRRITKKSSLVANAGSSGSRGSIATGRSTMAGMHPMSNHIKEHMAKHGLTHHTMAKECGVPHARLKKLAEGTAPTQEEMSKLGKHMGLPHEAMRKMGWQPHAPGHETDGMLETSRADADADDDDDGDETERASLDGMPTTEQTVPFEANADTMTTPIHGAEEVRVPHEGDEADENRHDIVPTAQDGVGMLMPHAMSLFALTGTRDPKKQKEVLLTMRQKAEAYDADHETVMALRRDVEERERRELVALARREKKLDPNGEKFWAKQPIATFREWLKTAHPLGIAGSGEEPLTPRTIGGVALTRDEIEVNEIMGQDPVAFAKFKAEAIGAQPFTLSRKMQDKIRDSFLGRDTNY